MNKQRIDPVDPATSSGSNKKNFDILKSALGLIPNMALAMASSDGLNLKQPGLTQWFVGKSGEIPERDALARSQQLTPFELSLWFARRGGEAPVNQTAC